MLAMGNTWYSSCLCQSRRDRLQSIRKAARPGPCTGTQMSANLEKNTNRGGVGRRGKKSPHGHRPLMLLRAAHAIHGKYFSLAF